MEGEVVDVVGGLLDIKAIVLSHCAGAVAVDDTVENACETPGSEGVVVVNVANSTAQRTLIDRDDLAPFGKAFGNGWNVILERPPGI